MEVRKDPSVGCEMTHTLCKQQPADTTPRSKGFSTTWQHAQRHVLLGELQMHDSCFGASPKLLSFCRRASGRIRREMLMDAIDALQ